MDIKFLSAQVTKIVGDMNNAAYMMRQQGSRFANLERQINQLRWQVADSEWMSVAVSSGGWLANPMTTAWDIIYWGVDWNPTKLSTGSDTATVELYVNWNRTDTYTENGSILAPYKTLKSALDFVNARAVIAAGNWDYTTARYTINVSPWDYSDDLTINNPYYLNIKLNGAVITGAVDIDTSMQSASAGGDNYSKIDFTGSTRGNRAYRGKQAQITGKISLKRNNDSLIYLGFAGIDLACDIEAVDAGTWIVNFQNCYGSDSAKAITGTFTDSTSYMLIESQGQNKLLHTWEGKVIFYNVEGMYFNVINTTPFAQNAHIKNSTFNSTVSMPSATAKTLSLDLLSYNSFISTTPTYTNYTIAKLGQDDTKLFISDIVDNVTSTDTDKALSANQGKILKDLIDALSTGLVPQGAWNASTNTPDITSTTTVGHYWIVDTAGNTNLDGITDWEVNDWAIKTATGWIKVDNTDSMPKATYDPTNIEADVFDRANHTGTQSTDTVLLDAIGTPKTVQDFVNVTQSSWYFEGWEPTDGGSGTLDVSELKGVIKTTDNPIGAHVTFILSAVTWLALTDNSTNYIYVDYNAGTPQFLVTTIRSNIRNTDQFTVCRVYKSWNTLTIAKTGNQLQNLVRRSHERLLDLYGFKRASGANILETGTRNIKTDAGVSYFWENEFITGAKDTSGTDTATYHYMLNGACTEVTGITQIDNAQYNDVSTPWSEVLANIGTGKYWVTWVFINFSGSLHFVYWQENYLNLAAAEAAQIPSNLPCIVSDFAIPSAKIITQQGVDAFVDNISLYTTEVGVQAPVDHGSLAGLWDDDHSQYPLLIGRVWGQTLYWGTASGEDLILESTSNATKWSIIVRNSKLDIITGATTNSAFHIWEVTGEGGYFTSTSDNHLSLFGGAELVGSDWKARSTSASSVNMESGTIQFFTDTGLTDGVIFTPTERFKIDTAWVATFNGAVVVGGSLTVQWTLTYLDTETLQVEDKNIEIGKVTTPTDVTANGGGITLLGTTNKTIVWDSSNSNWTSSEHWNIATGKEYKINNASVLTATTLGGAVVNSSLTKVWTIDTGTWEGTAIGDTYISSASDWNDTVDYVSDTEKDDGSITWTKTISRSDWKNHKATVTGNVAVTFSLSSAWFIQLKLTNWWAYTVTWSNTINWSSSTAPTLTSSGVDFVNIYFDGTNYYWDYGLDFS